MTIEVDAPKPLLARAYQGVQPQVMSLMFGACHDAGSFEPFLRGSEGGMRYKDGTHHLDLVHPEDVPFQLRRPDAKEQFNQWASTGVVDDVSNIDNIAWDVATLAVVTFYLRTAGDDIDRRYKLLLDDYFDWRGVKQQKRSREYRQSVNERIQLLFRTRVHAEMWLYLPDPETGRRRRQRVTTDGPFLVEASQFFRCGSPGPLNQKSGCPDGYVLSLGEWARAPVRERAMMALYFRALAQYDRGRQIWERQMGTYLLLQIQNQSPKMRIGGVGKDRYPIPQHALRLVTILDGAHLPWRTLATNDPGRVIRQTVEALKQNAKDELIGKYHCLDGAIDGSDLPVRGRLEAMLERRYLIHPGPLMAEHIIRKLDARARTVREDSGARKPRQF